MFTSRLMAILLAASLLSLFGCREIRYDDYTSVSEDLFGGTLIVIMIGGYGAEYRQGDKDFTDWAHPYDMQFTYRVEKNRPLVKLELKDVKITSEKTKDAISLPSQKSARVRVYGEEKLIRFSVGPLTREVFNY